MLVFVLVNVISSRCAGVFFLQATRVLRFRKWKMTLEPVRAGCTVRVVLPPSFWRQDVRVVVQMCESVLRAAFLPTTTLLKGLPSQEPLVFQVTRPRGCGATLDVRDRCMSVAHQSASGSHAQSARACTSNRPCRWLPPSGPLCPWIGTRHILIKRSAQLRVGACRTPGACSPTYFASATSGTRECHALHASM